MTKWMIDDDRKALKPAKITALLNRTCRELEGHAIYGHHHAST